MSTRMNTRMSPLRLFRTVAVAEAITWALLLTGMFLKYVTDTTELGVRVGGMVHGVVFIAYCLTTVVVAVDQRWSAGRTVLGRVD
jgi:integral membrane protein